MTKNIFLIIFILTLVLLIQSCSESPVSICSKQSVKLISSSDVNKEILRYCVNSVTDGFAGLVSKNSYDTTEIKNLITNFVEYSRYLDNLSGYFYCYDTNMTGVAHPILKNYIGTNHLEDVDSKGTKFAYIMRDSLRKYGKGFIEHYWLNQATGVHELKLAYIKLILGSNLFIGSGVFESYQSGWYVDSIGMKRELVRNMVHSTAKGFATIFKAMYLDSTKRIAFMHDFLDQIRFFDDKSGYYFVDDLNYNNIIFPTQKNLEGQNLYNYVDPKGNYPVRNMVDVIKGDGRGFVEYYFINPVNNKTEKKFVYVERIEGTDYFIGTGVYYN